MHGPQGFPWLSGARSQPVDPYRHTRTDSGAARASSPRSVLLGSGSREHSDLVQSVASYRLVFANTRVGDLFLCCRHPGLEKINIPLSDMETAASNQSMKPTALLRCNFGEVVATPCGGLSLSR